MRARVGSEWVHACGRRYRYVVVVRARVVVSRCVAMRRALRTRLRAAARVPGDGGDGHEVPDLPRRSQLDAGAAAGDVVRVLVLWRLRGGAAGGYSTGRACVSYALVCDVPSLRVRSPRAYATQGAGPCWRTRLTLTSSYFRALSGQPRAVRRRRRTLENNCGPVERTSCHYRRGPAAARTDLSPARCRGCFRLFRTSFLPSSDLRSRESYVVLPSTGRLQRRRDATVVSHGVEWSTVNLPIWPGLDGD